MRQEHPPGPFDHVFDSVQAQAMSERLSGQRHHTICLLAASALASKPLTDSVEAEHAIELLPKHAAHLNDQWRRVRQHVEELQEQLSDLQLVNHGLRRDIDGTREALSARNGETILEAIERFRTDPIFRGRVGPNVNIVGAEQKVIA